MNNDKSESTGIESNSHSDFAPTIVASDVAHSSVILPNNKKSPKQAVKDKYSFRQKLYSINEQRSLDRQLNSFSHYWDI